MHLSCHLSCTLYRKEGPPHPSQGLTMPCSTSKGPTSTTHSNTMPGIPSPKHKDGMKARRFAGVIQHMPQAGKPARYAKDLCPLPSLWCPHVLASERLQRWLPMNGHESTRAIPSNLTAADVQQISVVIGKLWEESTLAAYGSGLLKYHVFCDQKGIPEAKRAPASPTLIGAFIASIISTYLG